MIICMGSLHGDIQVAYLDEVDRIKGGRHPTILANFHFVERKFFREPNQNMTDLDRELLGNSHQPAVDTSFTLNSATFNNKKKFEKRSFSRISNPDMISDGYWDSVVMQAKDKKEGLDGIQIWNFAMQEISDFDQSTAFVKELAQFEIKNQIAL